jgi:hypothetical protein
MPESALREHWFCEVCATMRLIREAAGRCRLDPPPDGCPLPKLQKPARTQVGKIATADAYANAAARCFGEFWRQTASPLAKTPRSEDGESPLAPSR